MKRSIWFIGIIVIFNIQAIKEGLQYLVPENVSLVGDNVDDLVLKGVEHIKQEGERFSARAGAGQQAYDVSYTLLNPLNMVHNLRAPVSSKYFSRELCAYFRGSLKAEEGLAQAAPMWRTLADEDGKICSNYGYYVFHQRVPEFNNETQYEWVKAQLARNLDSRKAFININQPCHKVETSKDFPCTLGMQFFVRRNKLCSSVASRSTDIYTGLSYDIGFFAFVLQLLYRDMKQSYPEETKDLGLGYVTMKTNFTQIYDATRFSALKLLDKEREPYQTDMPEIDDAQATLKDIYNQTHTTPIMKWIEKHANLTE